MTEPTPDSVGLYCFINGERECGADCMAFLYEVPEGMDYQTPDHKAKQWAHCSLLVNAHKVAKHGVHLANCAETAIKLARNAAADQIRTAQNVPVPYTPKVST